MVTLRQGIRFRTLPPSDRNHKGGRRGSGHLCPRHQPNGDLHYRVPSAGPASQRLSHGDSRALLRPSCRSDLSGKRPEFRNRLVPSSVSSARSRAAGRRDRRCHPYGGPNRDRYARARCRRPHCWATARWCDSGQKTGSGCSKTVTSLNGMFCDPGCTSASSWHREVFSRRRETRARRSTAVAERRLDSRSAVRHAKRKHLDAEKWSTIRNLWGLTIVTS